MEFREGSGFVVNRIFKGIETVYASLSWPKDQIYKSNTLFIYIIEDIIKV